MAEAFVDYGYEKVYALKDGWFGWYMAKYPTEPKEPKTQPTAAPEQSPVLVGRITQEELFSSCPVFKEKAEKYSPHSETVKTIGKVGQKTQLLLFLGTWCGDSVSEAPKFLKVMASAQNPDLPVEIIGVDQKKQDDAGLVGQYGIERVPTIIFMRGDKEIGRIVEYPKMTMEEDVLSILKSGK